MKSLAITAVFLMLFVGCVIIPRHDSTHELLFQTGFNGSTILEKNEVSDLISGTDPDYSEKSAWDSIVDGRWINDAFINYEAGSRNQRYARIVDDPTTADNPVIEFRIMEPHIREGDHMKGRVSSVLRTSELFEITQNVSLLLHPDMENLKNWDKKIDWLTLFEFWCSDNYRITISLHKSESVGEDLYFEVSTSNKNILGYFTEEWSAKDTLYKVPYGRWMHVFLHITLGNNRQGNITMTVSDGDGQTVPIFNHNRSFGNSHGFRTISPMKLYTSGRLIDYMKDNGWDLSVCWDNLRIFRN